MTILWLDRSVALDKTLWGQEDCFEQPCVCSPKTFLPHFTSFHLARTLIEPYCLCSVVISDSPCEHSWRWWKLGLLRLSLPWCAGLSALQIWYDLVHFLKHWWLNCIELQQLCWGSDAWVWLQENQRWTQLLGWAGLGIRLRKVWTLWSPMLIMLCDMCFSFLSHSGHSGWSQICQPGIVWMSHVLQPSKLLRQHLLHSGCLCGSTQLRRIFDHAWKSSLSACSTLHQFFEILVISIDTCILDA